MNKFEPHELGMYLPYDLQFVSPDDNFQTQKTLIEINNHELVLMSKDTASERFFLDSNRIKALLKPINMDFVNTSKIYESLSPEGQWIIISGINSKKRYWDRLSFQDMNKLCKKHYDVFNMINRRLAVEHE